MSGWLAAILFIVAILVVVVIHEAGHFTMAKLFGIKVEEFFVGFGPRLWSIRRGETEYGVKALPFGGYVRIAGMNPFEETPPEEIPRTFAAKPIWQRALVIGAGPVTHFVMAILLLAVYFAVIGRPAAFRPVIEQTCALDPAHPQACPQTGPRSPAQAAGILPGDLVVSIDGRAVRSTADLVALTRAHAGDELTIEVLRDGKRLLLHATPVAQPVDGRSQGRLGIIVADGPVIARARTDPFTALGRGVIQTKTITWEIVKRLGDVFGPSGLKRVGQLLIGSGQRGQNDVVSVVGAGRLAAEAGSAGAWDAIFELFVLFNIFVGILNIVPLPPLDGGHLAVLAYEKIRRRRPDARKLIPVTAVVAAFLILFGLSIVYLDIVKPLPNPFQ